MFLGHWQFLRGFFELVYLRYLLAWFAIVPFALILLNKAPQQIKISDQPFYLNLSLPFSWWILWAASILYFVAFILYQAFCPAFIKRYPSFGEYKAIQHSRRWIVWEFFYAVSSERRDQNLVSAGWKHIYLFFSPLREQNVLYERIDKKGFIDRTELTLVPSENPKVEKEETAAYFLYDDKICKLACGSNSEEKERELFWEVFGHFAKQGKAVRSIIQALSLLAVLLVVFVAAQHVLTGIRLAFD